MTFTRRSDTAAVLPDWHIVVFSVLCSGFKKKKKDTEGNHFFLIHKQHLRLQQAMC